MKKCTSLILAVLICLTLSCRRQENNIAVPPTRYDPALLDGAEALRLAGGLTAIYPRNSGSAGAAEAAGFIRDQLINAGLSPNTDTFTNATPIGNITFRNVTAELAGETEETIILASHYDSKSGMPDGFTGANDSGSSSGLLMETARILASGKKPRCNILFAFFDGEESMKSYTPRDGLHGSRRLLSNIKKNSRIKNIKAVIVLDMIGDKDLNITLPANSTPAINSVILRAAEQENVRALFSLGRNRVIDDHEPFYNAGIPTSNMIDFHYGSVPGRNDYWHTQEDTIDKLSADSLAICGRVLIRCINFIMLD